MSNGGSGTSAIEFALQPIVQCLSGQCVGFEAVPVDPSATAAAADLREAADRAGTLGALDLQLREAAAAAFRQLAPADARLWLRLDARLLEADPIVIDELAAWAERHALARAQVCLELADLRSADTADRIAPVIAALRNHDFRIALDSFGTGSSSLRMLCELRPHFINLDRYFLAGIDRDYKRKILVNNVVSIAHALGALVLAKGIETDREFACARDIGCDLAQGAFIAPPVTDIGRLRDSYPVSGGSAAQRRRRADETALEGSLDAIEPIVIGTKLSVMFDRFRANSALTFLPVVDTDGHPLGLIREGDLKSYVYSPFGKDLLSNRVLGHTLGTFINPCPVVDVQTRAEQVIEIFSGNDTQDGMIVTRDGLYAGVLSARALVRMVHERNVAIARDQNPLTKLPGNNRIAEWVTAALDDRATAYVLAYFDFDNFKPFNDTLGFRQGDRAIILFAQLLTKTVRGQGDLVGHIGGDDFFIGLRHPDPDHAALLLAEIVRTFSSDAQALYDPASRERGYILGKDRDGNQRRFPLLSVSGVAVTLPAGRQPTTIDDVTAAIAEHKTAAKMAPDRLRHISMAA